MNWSCRVALLALLSSLSACGKPAPGPYDYYAGAIKFIDDAPANEKLEEGLSDLTFTDLDQKESTLAQIAQGRPVVLVITRGNTTPICPYCSTQTAEYFRDYSKFKERDCEVVIVYPVEDRADGPKLPAFLKDARTKLQDPKQPVPFPVLLDVQLKAVDRLGIRKALSKPATYIVDREGTVRYAYVGANIADRPSTIAVLKEVDRFAPTK